MKLTYTAIKTFDHQSDGWEKYKEWIKLPQLEEIISLDSMLNPCVFDIDNDDPEEFDYFYIEGNVIRGSVYTSLDFVTKKSQNVSERYNILALQKEPTTDCALIKIDGFTFIGYDLLDKDYIASALTNCGGFYESYSPHDINKSGLISDFTKIHKIREDILTNNPLEDHADCFIWAIWKKDKA